MPPPAFPIPVALTPLIPPNPVARAVSLSSSSRNPRTGSRRVFFPSFSRFASDEACTTPRAPLPAYPHAPHHLQVTPDFAMAAVTMSMAAVKPALVGANKSAFKGTRVSAVAPKKVAGGRATLQVRTPAMRPPAPAPATDASLETIARARARPRAPLDRIARASYDVVVASTTRARGDTGSRDSSKTRAIAPIQGPARRVRRGYAPGSPRARAEASAGFRRRSPRRARAEAWRATRASDARPRARDPAHVRAPGALRAHPPALYPLAAVWRASWHSDPARSNPGFLSHEPGRRKSEKRFVLSPVFFSEVFSSRDSST